MKLLHRKRVSSLLLKLDISKAFDFVARSFLLEVLSHRGFCYKWINLITVLLRSSSSRVLINGSPSDSEPIMHGRGLHQGYPISPMLFLLVIDVLDALIGKFDHEHICFLSLRGASRLPIRR